MINKITANSREFQGKAMLKLLVIICTGFILSVAAFQQLRNMDIQRKHEYFHHLAHLQSEAVVDQLAMSIASLKSVQGYIRSSTTIQRSDFRTFVDTLSSISGIQALEWIPRISNAERKQYEISVSKGQNGISDFQISERLTQGNMVPASERKEYFPVHFVEPLLGNRAAVGFDLGSNPARLQALNISRDSGEIYATSRITLVQEFGSQYGFLVFAPVYRSEKLPTTVEDRRLNLKGFALGVFRIGDMMKSAYHLRNGKKSDIAVYLLDNSDPLAQQVLFPKGAEEQVKIASNQPLRYSYQIKNAGREWSLLIVPAAASTYLQNSWQPYVILIAGFLITISISLHVFSTGNRTAFAENLVQKRTGELQNTNRALIEAQHQLRQMALHDSLTGAPNRNSFYNKLESTLSTAEREQLSFAILVIDLNKFKLINDTMGHQSGDEVLKTLVIRLNSVVRRGDLLARIGGDEFVVLMNLNSNSSSATRLVQRIKSLLIEPILISRQKLKIDLSVGIAVYPDHGKNADTLIERADRAMYAAKTNGKFFVISDNNNSVSKVA